MNNNTKKKIDIASISKDIKERDEIISRYITTGNLDRNEVIRKIVELQNTDIEVRIATSTKQVTEGFLDLSSATDNQLINNLNFQLEFLKSKLVKKAMEDDE